MWQKMAFWDEFVQMVQKKAHEFLKMNGILESTFLTKFFGKTLAKCQEVLYYNGA